MGLETLYELFRERVSLVEAQFAACETADAAAVCASGFLGALREAYVAGCEDARLRLRASDLLTACQSAAGLIAGLSKADVSLRLPGPSFEAPRARRALSVIRRYTPTALCAVLAGYLLLRNELPAAILAFAAAVACFFMPVTKAPAAILPEARGVPRPEPQEMTQRLSRLLRDVDALLTAQVASEIGAPLLTGPVLESIQLLCEASLTGDSAFALRAASPLVSALEAQGLQLMLFSPESAGWFDLLPGAGGGRTIRPALIKDGHLLARGQAIASMR
jgi:hypothetical protein